MLALPPRGPWRGIRTIRDLAYFLKIPEMELLRWAYARREDHRYVKYPIPKRSGGTRTISAPKEPLKQIQRSLLDLLYPAAPLSEAVHGFREKRSIVTNARRHVRATSIYKIDIEDFFPSIGLRRVYKMFMAYPFLFPSKVAIVLAKLCTCNDELPQGAPTSPFISNVIMRRCDSQLRAFARGNGLMYTRYADDLTFSSRQASPPNILNLPAPQPPSPTATSVPLILEKAGFKVNTKKSRHITRQQRMRVTGITINKRLNVSRDYIRRVRKLIYLVKKLGVPDATVHFLTHLDPRRHARRNTKEDLIVHVIEGRLAHIEHARGKDDLLSQRLRDSFKEALLPGSTDSLAPLRKEWTGILQESRGQIRGYRLERFWTDLCRHFDVEVYEPFAVEGEQVDGALRVEGHIYLVECKAGVDPTQPKAIDALYGKLERRLEGTRGIFLALSGYTKSVPKIVSEYNHKKIILLQNKDIEIILSGKLTLERLIGDRVLEATLLKIQLRYAD
jgi:RNA-directed DNA polymerase